MQREGVQKSSDRPKGLGKGKRLHVAHKAGVDEKQNVKLRHGKGAEQPKLLI